MPFFFQNFSTTIPLHRADLFPSVPGGLLLSQGSLTTSGDCQPGLNYNSPPEERLCHLKRQNDDEPLVAADSIYREK